MPARIYTKHGMRRTIEYRTWDSMIQRCNNPKNTSYHNYGARGIAVCKRWLNFVGFFEDMGIKPIGLTLERKNNNLGYCKNNCCWENRTKQARNKRTLKTNKTGINGVSWNKARGKLDVRISLGNNKRLFIGQFVELEQAARARKDAELEHWTKRTLG